jgi:hypothetical protein
MSRRVLSRTEVIAAHTLMQKYLKPSERVGFFNYIDDWSDAKVAQELDSEIQATAIGNLRTELFGKLDTAKNITHEENKRLKELETLVNNLLSCYGELEIKYNKLVDTIAINRVINTNILHLKTTVKETSNAAK